MMRLLLTMVATLTWATSFAAEIGITPPRQSLAAAPGETVSTTVTVLTTAATEERVVAATSDWTLGVGGELTYLPAASLPSSAASWLALEADEFALAPGGSRELRIQVTVPEDAEGTYHAMVFFTVVPAPTDTPGVGVTTTARVGLTVYVTVTGTERSGSELVDLYRPDPATLAAVVVNSGNTVMRLGGTIELRNEAGDVVQRLPVPDVPVLRESEREVRFDLPDDLEPGFYVVLALIEDDRGGLLAGELPIEIP